MSEKIYVYSTLSAPVKYQNYVESASDMPNLGDYVLIKGGANVAGELMTPLGVVTIITPEQLAILEQNKTFQLHKENGFIKVRGSHEEVEKIVADMQGRDDSAPLVPQDFQDADGAKPQEPIKKSSKK